MNLHLKYGLGSSIGAVLGCKYKIPGKEWFMRSENITKIQETSYKQFSKSLVGSFGKQETKLFLERKEKKRRPATVVDEIQVNLFNWVRLRGKVAGLEWYSWCCSPFSSGSCELVSE